MSEICSLGGWLYLIALTLGQWVSNLVAHQKELGACETLRF